MAKIVKVELHSCDFDKKSNCYIVTYNSGLTRKFGYTYLANHGGFPPATVGVFIGNGFCTNDETVNGVQVITYKELPEDFYSNNETEETQPESAPEEDFDCSKCPHLSDCKYRYKFQRLPRECGGLGLCPNLRRKPEQEVKPPEHVPKKTKETASVVEPDCELIPNETPESAPEEVCNCSKYPHLSTEKNRKFRKYSIYRSFQCETRYKNGNLSSKETETEWKQRVISELSDLKALKASDIAFIFHDKDVYDDGTIKGLHVHAVITFSDLITLSDASKITGCFPNLSCFGVKNKVDSYRYLIHLTEDDHGMKYIYDWRDVICLSSNPDKPLDYLHCILLQDENFKAICKICHSCFHFRKCLALDKVFWCRHEPESLYHRFACETDKNIECMGKKCLDCYQNEFEYLDTPFEPSLSAEELEEILFDGDLPF